ncbi:MAG: HAMP domain-containing sensor histidine kinase [Candidatus Eisenbacteria bacterium]
MDLCAFIVTNRDEIIRRAREKVALRTAPHATPHQLANGVPLFLTQLGDILRLQTAHPKSTGSEIGLSANKHGSDLLAQGFSIAQVVHDYGDICQAVTELAVDVHVPIGTEDFHTLNKCLDNAIAGAVTGYSHQRDVDAKDEITRQAFFAHELRNYLNTASLALQVVKTGRVGISGSTFGVLDRSLRGLRELVDRSVSEVRLTSGYRHKERIRVAEFLEEMEINAAVDAADRGLLFTVEQVDNRLQVDVDRHLFASAISNLLNNAFKFTRPSGHVSLRTHSSTDRVSIEVEDECGGLLPGAAEAFFRPFEQRGTDRAGLGLGLAISRRAVESDGGSISLRDIPGRGCVFTIEMPLATGNPPES